jgi:hypothetical protein
MATMKPPQFSIRSMMLLLAFAAVWFAGIADAISYLSTDVPRRLASTPFFYFGEGLSIWTPAYVPFIAFAYVLGRRSISTWMVVAFALCEGAAVVAARYLLGAFHH